MISIILFALASIFDAIMDTLETGHFSNSVFKHLDPKFWAKDTSWQHATKIGGYPLDAWHITKTFMIFSLALGVVFYKPLFEYWWMDFIGLGVVWIACFDLFYNVFLVKKS